MDSILSTLNPAQRRAVMHDPSIPLQILAGPGSGKTKVLTSRIARLILEDNLAPSSICAVTFTNKAANEMRARLTKLIGVQATQALQMGTFHSICSSFLRRYASAIGIDENFTICDAGDGKRLITDLIMPYGYDADYNDIKLTPAAVSSAISRAKSKGQSPAMLMEEATKLDTREGKLRPSRPDAQPLTYRQVMAEIYSGYEAALRKNNSLDFDDLLVYGVKLFKEYPSVVAWCNHMLVDEFQDTNSTQYELLKAMATKKCVTIVGDPDQSIYGWRSADVANLSYMTKDFAPVTQIMLETNYRSTSAILRSSLAIVAEDKSRIGKSLNTTHADGVTPFVGSFYSEKEEADFIASEIKRCITNMGGALNWGDFVILLRFNALSRALEVAFQKAGIPSRVLGGHKFFERQEVKDILAYLQLVDNPNFMPAFVRTVNLPARQIGAKVFPRFYNLWTRPARLKRTLGSQTLASVVALAQELDIPPLTVVERIYDGKMPDIKPPIQRKVESYVKAIRALRKMDEQGKPPSEMIRELLKMIHYEEYLQKTQPDWETRWENMNELITFACEAENAPPPPPVPGDDGTESSEVKEVSRLRQFLQTSMLSSEGDNDAEDDGKGKVTLSTCHAAKGLEWPVVFIPSVEDGTFPFYRTEDADEERRLLYVGCTRAQSLLYITHAAKRQVAGTTTEKRLSPFVADPQLKDRSLFSHHLPQFTHADRAVICNVLGRPIPDVEEVNRKRIESSPTRGRSSSSSRPNMNRNGSPRPDHDQLWLDIREDYLHDEARQNQHHRSRSPPKFKSALSAAQQLPGRSGHQGIGSSSGAAQRAFDVEYRKRILNENLTPMRSNADSNSRPPLHEREEFSSRRSSMQGSTSTQKPKSSIERSLFGLAPFQKKGIATAAHRPPTSRLLDAGTSIRKPLHEVSWNQTALDEAHLGQLHESLSAATPSFSPDQSRAESVREPPRQEPIPNTRVGATDATIGKTQEPTVPPQLTTTSVKRRLGMGARGTTGYANKKFKPPS